MKKAEYEVFESLNPFFEIVLRGLSGLVDGEHYFDTIADSAIFESRYPIALQPLFPGKHKTINHSRTYGIGEVHTNTIENAFSLLKRGLYGTFHKVSVKHRSDYEESGARESTALQEINF